MNSVNEVSDAIALGILQAALCVVTFNVGMFVLVGVGYWIKQHIRKRLRKSK